MDDNALEIIEWLASDECHELDGAGLIDGLGAKLSKAGMALHRMVFHLRALHPTVLGRSIAWAPGGARRLSGHRTWPGGIIAFPEESNFARGIDSKLAGPRHGRPAVVAA